VSVVAVDLDRALQGCTERASARDRTLLVRDSRKKALLESRLDVAIRAEPPPSPDGNDDLQRGLTETFLQICAPKPE